MVTVRATVLIADRSAVARAMMSRALDGLGLEVREVADHDALEAVGTSDVGLAVLDLDDESLGGSATLGRWAAQGDVEHVIVVSRHGSDRSAGLRDLRIVRASVQKPFRLGEFRATVQRVLGSTSRSADVRREAGVDVVTVQADGVEALAAYGRILEHAPARRPEAVVVDAGSATRANAELVAAIVGVLRSSRRAGVPMAVAATAPDVARELHRVAGPTVIVTTTVAEARERLR